MHALETRHLTVTYDGSPALWNVSATIPAMSITGIIGPNGAGKSTFLKAILGIVPKVSGTVRLADDAATSATAIAYVPQRSSVDWDFPTTVFDLVMMGTYGRLKWFRRPGRQEKSDTWDALRLVGMEDLAGRQIGELSGGQQQRIFLARAFVQQPSVYFLDEPFAGVDAKTEANLMQILRQLRDEGSTVVMVHHDLTTVKSYFDQVILLNQQLIGCGLTGDVFTEDALQSAYGRTGQALLERP